MYMYVTVCTTSSQNITKLLSDHEFVHRESFVSFCQRFTLVKGLTAGTCI